MNKIKELIKSDLHRYSTERKIPFYKKYRLYGYQYTKLWRKANYYKETNRLLFVIYGFFLLRKSIKYGFQISPYASIGSGLYIGHFGSVIVGNEVKMGDNVNLSSDVVIGRTARGKLEGSPVIGNNVWIGSGAKIVGKITIGDDVLIAPNSYVNIDIPNHSIVIGNPCSIYKKDNATYKYI